jgi:hypothetical protein
VGGGYYKLHKPLLGIMAIFKVHNHNPQKYHIPISIYNPWSTKTICISQITTGSSLKEQGFDISKTGVSPDLKRLKNHAVICENQICPQTRDAEGGH